MLRLTILVTAALSFVHFMFPKTFAPAEKTGETILGIRQTTQALNLQTVKTAVLAYCLSTTELPEKLNDLFQNELLRERFLDLDNYFNLEKGSGFCQFKLTPKN
jgi:hypothetical protein